MRHAVLVSLSLLSLVAPPALAANMAAPATSKPAVAAPTAPAVPTAPTAPAAPPAAPPPQAPVAQPAETEPPLEMPRPGLGGRIEDRLRAAHDRLQLTATQGGLWENVLKTLDENQKVMNSLNNPDKPLDALASLQLNQKIAETRAAGIKRLTGAVEKLYDALSDAQKKQLDQALASSNRRPNLP